MPHIPEFAPDSTTSRVLIDLMIHSPHGSTPKKLQILWQNICAAYFPPAEGYHIEASDWKYKPLYVPTSSVLLVDVYKHDLTNVFPPKSPTLKLRVICADLAVSNLDCLNYFNLTDPLEQVPHNLPYCIITRHTSDEHILAKFAAWMFGPQQPRPLGRAEESWVAYLQDHVANLMTAQGLQLLDSMLRCYREDRQGFPGQVAQLQYTSTIAQPQAPFTPQPEIPPVSVQQVEHQVEPMELEVPPENLETSVQEHGDHFNLDPFTPFRKARSKEALAQARRQKAREEPLLKQALLGAAIRRASEGGF
jgi:hypothetical protein